MAGLVSGRPLWAELNPDSPSYGPMVEDQECDVVVVGGGIGGGLMSYYLAQAGVDVVLLDADCLGRGSTSASTSILQYEIDYDLEGLAKLIGGTDQAVKAFKRCEAALRDITEVVGTLDDKCGFSGRDSLYYTASKSAAKAMEVEYLARKHNGFDVEFLTRESARDRFSFEIEAGIYSKALGGEVDPIRLTHALIASAGKRLKGGLRVFEHTAMTESRADGSRMILETSRGKRISADKVAICTGYEARKLVSETIATMKTSFALATAPVEAFDGWQGRCVMRDDGSPYTYLRTTHDDRIIIGGRDSGVLDGDGRLLGMLPLPGALDRQYAALGETLTAMFPGIRGIKPEYQFAGVFGDTKDGLPYIGEHPDHPGYYFGMCYGSNGILYAVLAGQIIRDLYLGGTPDMELFRFGR